MSASSGKKRWSMSANSGRQSVCLRIHSIIRSTAYFCSSGVNSLPGRMPCHLNRHWRQQVAVACWAMNTGWPRIGVCRRRQPLTDKIFGMPADGVEPFLPDIGNVRRLQPEAAAERRTAQTGKNIFCHDGAPILFSLL